MNNWLVWLLSFILPRRMWYRNYYMRSKHWRMMSKLKKEFMQYRCERCKRIYYNQDWFTSLDVHHLRYYRNGKSILWHEELYDLQVLCRTCHNKEHERK